MGVSLNGGFPPKESILIGFSIINYPFRGTLIFGNTHIQICDQVFEKQTPATNRCYGRSQWELGNVDAFCILYIYIYWIAKKQYTKLGGGFKYWNGMGCISEMESASPPSYGGGTNGFKYFFYLDPYFWDGLKPPTIENKFVKVFFNSIICQVTGFLRKRPEGTHEATHLFTTEYYNWGTRRRTTRPRGTMKQNGSKQLEGVSLPLSMRTALFFCRKVCLEIVFWVVGVRVFGNLYCIFCWDWCVLHGMCSATIFSRERYPKRVLFTSNPSRMTGFQLISHAGLSRTATWKQATKDDTECLHLNFISGKTCNPDLLMNA